MAMRDYILCKKCECKLIPDGDDNARDHMESKWGYGNFLLCPDCIAELESELNEKTCNCRWGGETQIKQCEFHAAHVSAIHEWAERAKAAERRISDLEQQLQDAKAATRKAIESQQQLDDYIAGLLV